MVHPSTAVSARRESQGLQMAASIAGAGPLISLETLLQRRGRDHMMKVTMTKPQWGLCAPS